MTRDTKRLAAGRLRQLIRSDGVVPVFALLTLGSGAADVTAQQWQALPDRQEVAIIEKQQVAFTIRPEVSFADGSNAIDARLRVATLLDDLQAKAPAILGALAERESSCETRWSFPALSPVVVEDGKLKIAGDVRVEQWFCGIGKNRLGRETASFALALHPVASPDKVKMTAELEHFDLGRSLIGGAADGLRNLLSSSLNDALDRDDATLRFPPEAMPFHPRFTSADLSDVGGGTGELHVEASAVITAAQLTDLIKLISK